MARKMSVLGIDIAKLVFHVVGMDDTGTVVLRKRIARSEVLHFIVTLPPLLIGMVACGSAHYWARCFQAHGHDVRLIAPQFVKAYVKSPKNDARDAKAICEAITRPTMRFVPITRVEQQNLQALHRGRERLIKARTALVNEMRGLLNEYGIVLPQSIAKFRASIGDKLICKSGRIWHRARLDGSSLVHRPWSGQTRVIAFVCARCRTPYKPYASAPPLQGSRPGHANDRWSSAVRTMRCLTNCRRLPRILIRSCETKRIGLR